ncbi:DUF2851 family protein [Ancylomarina sp. DW003]|nr:DUF2851 family protein [Ancylomarina sp. DW003]MDE5424288.1 DUF2851 family protein [Ancylomarina sp. DW003]
MNENFLHYIWKYRLFNQENLVSNQGQQLEIVEVGKLNINSGPDFFEARIKIDGLLWVGNIEIHKKSSDWYKHQHEIDPAYNNVILHVVMESDVEVVLSDKRILPSLELVIPEQYANRYQSLMESQLWIPCQNDISSLNNFFVKHWLDRMLLERLERKSVEIKKIYAFNSSSWEETLYQLMSRYFGMNVNSEPFEQLARSIPLKVLAKHKDSLFQIEAILFGQAGFLDDQISDDKYYLDLQSEYKFLKGKFKLMPIKKEQWKFMRLHPLNFPTVRIAQLATLIYQSQSLFSKLIQIDNLLDFYPLLQVKASAYWETHYKFGEIADSKSKFMGKATVDILIINAIVPMFFLYGKETDKPIYIDKALSFLENLKPEKNNIIKSWVESGVKSKSAYDSQSLLHLKAEYCGKYRCLECELGNRIIRIE